MPVGEPGELEQLTVVIPAWGARYLEGLEGAIASLGSDPNTRILVASDEDLHPPPPAEFVRLPRSMSVGAARNAALERVETPLVCFLDADDRLRPAALARMRSALVGPGRGRVAVAGRVVDADTGETITPRRWSYGLSRAPAAFRLANLLWALYPSQGATLFRTAAVRAAGGYADDDGGEDWALSIDLLRIGNIDLIDDVVLDCDTGGAVAGTEVSRREMRRRAALVRRRWAAGAPRLSAALAMPVLAATHFLLIEGVWPLVRAARGYRSSKKT